MRRPVKVDVYSMYESCKRTTFFVRLTTDEGMTMDPESFASHSIYNDMDGTVGLTVEEARDRALTSAHEWADFFQLEVTPYYEEGVLYEPLMTFDTYTMRREEAAEDAAAAVAGDPHP
jgi:hypothetical protein